MRRFLKYIRELLCRHGKHEWKFECGYDVPNHDALAWVEYCPHCPAVRGRISNWHAIMEMDAAVIRKLSKEQL